MPLKLVSWYVQFEDYSNKHRFTISLVAFKFWSEPKNLVLVLCNQTLSRTHAEGLGTRLHAQMVWGSTVEWFVYEL